MRLKPPGPKQSRDGPKEPARKLLHLPVRRQVCLELMKVTHAGVVGHDEGKLYLLPVICPVVKGTVARATIHSIVVPVSR